MKKIILTETQIKRTISKIIEEQSNGTNFNKTVQCFLNTVLRVNLPVDGIIGPQTTALIEKFQVSRGIYPSDGVWGEITASKLKGNDLQIYNNCKSQYGDFLDKAAHFLHVD